MFGLDIKKHEENWNQFISFGQAFWTLSYVLGQDFMYKDMSLVQYTNVQSVPRLISAFFQGQVFWSEPMSKDRSFKQYQCPGSVPRLASANFQGQIFCPKRTSRTIARTYEICFFFFGGGNPLRVTPQTLISKLSLWC